MLRGNTNLNTSHQIESALTDFIENRSIRYYQEHLEELYPSFSQLLSEFSDGNLLFEVMQRNVWEAALNDSVGLKRYYDQNKSAYIWDAGADALVFQVDDDSLVKVVKTELAKDRSGWKFLSDNYNGRIRADSGRYEFSQLPAAPAGGFRAGTYSAPLKDPEQGLLNFIYVIRLYKGKDQKSFEEARGMVSSDYQEYLEQQWMAELTKKYPVKINQPVLDELLATLE